MTPSCIYALQNKNKTTLIKKIKQMICTLYYTWNRGLNVLTRHFYFVYVCGRETWYEPKRVEGLNGVSVKSAFASGVISTAIGVDGSLWVWGKSKRGQLGLGKGITEAVLPSRVEALAEEEIVKVVSA